MFLVEVLSGLLRPTSCLACGVPAAWPCCARCLPPDPADVGPWPLAADPDLVCWTLGPYRDALRAAVLAGKFDGQPAALAELGRRLGAALAEGGIGADLVTWVAARRVAGGRVLLVDDLATTGATLAGAAAALRLAAARRVEAAVLATAPAALASAPAALRTYYPIDPGHGGR